MALSRSFSVPAPSIIPFAPAYEDDCATARLHCLISFSINSLLATARIMTLASATLLSLPLESIVSWCSFLPNSKACWFQLFGSMSVKGLLLGFRSSVRWKIPTRCPIRGSNLDKLIVSIEMNLYELIHMHIMQKMEFSTRLWFTAIIFALPPRVHQSSEQRWNSRARSECVPHHRLHLPKICTKFLKRICQPPDLENGS